MNRTFRETLAELDTSLSDLDKLIKEMKESTMIDEWLEPDEVNIMSVSEDEEEEQYDESYCECLFQDWLEQGIIR